MRYAVTGSSGLIGSELTRVLQASGHEVVKLVRRPPQQIGGDEVSFLPDGQGLDAERLGPVDVIVHLAGHPIASGRWTESFKGQVRDSRVVGTRALVDGLRNLPSPPKVLISASAIGIYGDRGDEELIESTSPGDDFLAQTCREWEAEAMRAAELGIRVVCLRLGMVLAPNGGALQRMLPFFRMGLGGRLGSGRQWVSWVALPDVVGAVRFISDRTDLTGPVNMVAPEPVTNAEFTRALARTLRRPALFPAPAFGLRLLYGEMADALLLASQKVKPSVLTERDFAFRYPDIEAALRWALG